MSPARAKKKAPARKTAAGKKAAGTKAAPKRTARKKAPQRTARKTARPTAPRKKAPRRLAKPAPPPAFPQRAGATPKQLVLFELTRARTTFLSAIQGLGAGAAEPIAAGKWSPLEIVLHVVTRDLARLRELEPALRGTPPSWKGARQEDWLEINETNLAPLRHHGWDEALRLLHRTRQQLVEEIESVPEEPSEIWSSEHAFGGMLATLPPHDRHHADQIKRWRASRGA